MASLTLTYVTLSSLLTVPKVKVYYCPSATAEPEEVMKTEKQRSTLNPNWLEKAEDRSALTHSVTMQDECLLVFKLFDWDRVGGHDPL